MKEEKLSSSPAFDLKASQLPMSPQHWPRHRGLGGKYTPPKWVFTRRSWVRFSLDHVLFILSWVVYLLVTWLQAVACEKGVSWTRINSVRNEGRPAAVNQRQAKKWRRQISSKRTKEAQISTLKHSLTNLRGRRPRFMSQCRSLWTGRSIRNEGRWFGKITLIKLSTPSIIWRMWRDNITCYLCNV